MNADKQGERRSRNGLGWPRLFVLAYPRSSAFIRGYCCLFALDQGEELRRTGSGGSEDIAGGERAIRGVSGRDARRPGVRGGPGVLERAEGLPERATGERPLVDEHSTGRCGEDVQRVEGGGGKAEWPRISTNNDEKS